MYIGIALTSFLLGLFVSWKASENPAHVGCGLPIAVMAITFLAIMVVRPESSTAGVAIPIYGMLSVCGSIPGALLGTILRHRDLRRRRL
ncbi:hypothetical protein [uncultured Sphingomonas sp.]|uniref:hypothetical protein n=1 Tax=Sphingomonas sp. TaxID=28214 RepID=UPI002625AB98|nr:hypothetical protein [uncultured Sphingomonas sp.]